MGIQESGYVGIKEQDRPDTDLLTEAIRRRDIRTLRKI
jgi:hypothetical protein